VSLRSSEPILDASTNVGTTDGTGDRDDENDN